MSRIGKLPISVPGGVTITVDDGNTVTVKAPRVLLVKRSLLIWRLNRTMVCFT